MDTVTGKIGAKHCDIVHGNGTESENHNKVFLIIPYIPIFPLSSSPTCIPGFLGVFY